MAKANLQNDKIKAEIKKLEARNTLRQTYADWYAKTWNFLNYAAFTTAIARDENNIAKLKMQL